MRRIRVKKKTELKWRPILASMAATEKTRYTLNYIFRTKNMYVASDGKALGIVCGESINGEQFLHAKAFRDVDAAVTTGGLYPNVAQVIPDSAKADVTVHLDGGKFDEHLKLVAALAKADSHISYSAENGELVVGVSVCGKWFPKFTPGHWAFDTKHLIRAMMLAKARSGDAGVTIELHGRSARGGPGDGPIVIRWQNAGELALVMPIDPV